MKLLLGNWHLKPKIWRFKHRGLAFMKLIPGLRSQTMRIFVNWSQNQVHKTCFSLHSYSRYILETWHCGKFLGQYINSIIFLDSTGHLDLDDLHILNSMMFQYCTTKSSEQFSLQQFSRTLKSMAELFAKNFSWPAQSSSQGNKNMNFGTAVL